LTLFSLLTRPPPPSPLFPYTTLFRSNDLDVATLLLRKRARLLVHQHLRQRDDRVQRRPQLVAQPRAQAASQARRVLVRLTVGVRSEEHTSELQSLTNLVCRLLLEKKT